MNRSFRLLAIMVIALSVGSQTCFGQKTDDQLLSTRVDLHLESGTLMEALGKLAKNKVPIGWEPSPADKQKFHLNLDLKNAPLSEVLDLILQGETRYQWMLRDGVINIAPVNDRDPVVERLLLVQISDFDPPKGLVNFFLRDAVTELPEVVAFLKANGLTASHSGNGYPSAPAAPGVEIRSSGVELRSLLNRICRETRMKLWTVSRSGPTNQWLNLSF